MKKKFAKVFVMLLCAGCVLGSCGKQEEKKVAPKETAKEVKEETEKEEKLQSVGNKSTKVCHILMTNETGKNITGLAVKRLDETEYPANMLKSEQKIEDKEKFDFYYTAKEEKYNSENEGKEQNSELADAVIKPTYSLQVSFEDKTVVELSSFAIEDMEETVLCFENDVYFFKYRSVSEKTEVTTKEMELMVKADNEKADAVLKQIEGIGEITLETEANLQSIRAAYDALTDMQKTKVTNLNKLADAEKKLAELKQNAETNNTTVNQSSNSGEADNFSESSQLSDYEEPAASEEAVEPEEPVSEEPAAPEETVEPEQSEPEDPAVPEQSTDGCLDDVEIYFPEEPEQSEDGCLGDVEINQ